MRRVLAVTIIGNDFAIFLTAVEVAGDAASPGDILGDKL
jgi:hypothetical protein